jgi:AAA15 family ATPase/GTPase
VQFIAGEGTTIEIESEKTIREYKEAEELSQERLRLNQRLFLDNQKVFDSNVRRSGDSIVEHKGKKIFVRGSIRSTLLGSGFFYYRPLFIEFDLPSVIDCVTVPGMIKTSFGESYQMDLFNLKTQGFIHFLFFKIEGSYDGDVSRIKKMTKASLLKKLKIDQKIIDNLRRFSPIQDIKFNENINIYKEDKSITVENLRVDFKVNGNWIPWSQLSDGTKRMYYLITEVTYDENRIVLIEEPELGVHPHQLHLIMQFLQEEAEKRQIIISTHSTQTLNFLKEDQLSNILIAEYDSTKGTLIKHMTKPQMTKAKKYMKEVGFLSDYWMHSDLEA